MVFWPKKDKIGETEQQSESESVHKMVKPFFEELMALGLLALILISAVFGIILRQLGYLL